MFQIHPFTPEMESHAEGTVKLLALCLLLVACVSAQFGSKADDVTSGLGSFSNKQRGLQSWNKLYDFMRKRGMLNSVSGGDLGSYNLLNNNNRYVDWSRILGGGGGMAKRQLMSVYPQEFGNYDMRNRMSLQDWRQILKNKRYGS
jgi:hypothetical protein